MTTVHDADLSMGWKDSQGNPTNTHPVIARAMRSLLDKSDNERSGVISEIKGFLELYRDPVIAANTATSDFRIEDLMNHRRPVSLYVVVSLAHKDSLRPLIRLMLSQILHRLTERLEYRAGRAITGYRHRLLLMIDEFASLGRLDMFADSLSLIAGYGIKACLIAQDLSQIHAAYGHDEAITSNCHTRVAFTPNRIETARLLSQMAGEATVRHAHRTFSSMGASFSEPEVARPLITPDEATRLGSKEALIFTSGQPAIRATKIRYYTEPFFKRRAAIQPPSKSDRIASPTTDDKVASPTASPIAIEIMPNMATPAHDQSAPQTNSLAKAPIPQPNGQLTFLKFAVEHAADPAAATNRGRKKERLL
jgi:type IV secretion system protein VirD4